MVSQRTRVSSPPRAGDYRDSSDTKEEQPVPPVTSSGAYNDAKEGHQLFAHCRNAHPMRGLQFSRWKTKILFQMRVKWMIPSCSTNTRFVDQSTIRHAEGLSFRQSIWTGLRCFWFQPMTGRDSYLALPSPWKSAPLARSRRRPVRDQYPPSPIHL